jgi:hypothetical protein
LQPSKSRRSCSSVVAYSRCPVVGCRKRRYSFTTSICLSSTWPLQRSIAMPVSAEAFAKASTSTPTACLLIISHPLLNYFFKLRAEHSSVVAIKRDMEPIPFFTLDDEFCRVGKICCPWSVISRLRDYVDHQVPGSRLTYLCQRASDRLLCFVRGSQNPRQRHGLAISGFPSPDSTPWAVNLARKGTNAGSD